VLGLTFFLYVGHDLHATAASPNHSNTLSFQRVPFFVRSGMHEFALVLLETGNIWHFPLVQNSTGIDEKLCFMVDDSI
jgi:hypothetical protein